MSRLLEAIAKNRFVVFGRAGMDLYAHPVGVRSEDAEIFHSGLGGSSANICVGICKFGGQASIVTSVSDDAVGRFCRNALRRYGVGTEYVRSVGGEFRNQVAIYESVLEGFQNVLYRNGAADFEVTVEDTDRVDLSRFGALVTAGTVFAGEPARSSTFAAIDRARAQAVPIIFDIDYRPYSWPSPQVAAEVLSRAGAASDMIVGNDEEFGFMAGGQDQGLAMARHLAETPGRIVIYKMGEGGAVTFADGAEIRTGIYPVTAVKPNGAGDSFMAGLLSGLAAGQSLREAVLRGSACAAIVVSRPGCAAALPDEADLAAFLAAHPGPTDPESPHATTP
ncbi:MAG: PfkB family carbohydrate kinase [Pseudomonadota bacterium]